MAMMVSGLILSATVSLAWALGSYNDEGSGRVALATHGRFAMTLIGRDVRGARAMTVSSTGGLVLWMGDLDEDNKMDANEFVLYYKPDRDDALWRMGFEADLAVGAVGPASLATVVQMYDMGTLMMAPGLGAVPEKVCGYVEGVSFSANRELPETLSVETVLSLSRSQNRVQDTGRDVELNLYGTATMRAPCEDNGFDPQT